MRNSNQKGFISTKIILIIIGIAVIGGGAVLVWSKFSDRSICTQDVKECSDGSYVRRIAPLCKFKKCPDINTGNRTENSDTSTCTKETKQCSDGSYVKRIVPDCEFEKCSKVADITPAITILSPNGGEEWEVEETYKIEWQYSNNLYFSFVSVWLVPKDINASKILLASSEKLGQKELQQGIQYLESATSFEYILPISLLTGLYNIEVNTYGIRDSGYTDVSDASFSIVNNNNL